MSYTPPPVICEWDGKTFAPLSRFARVCDKAFTIGEAYPLVVQEARSQATHSHYFACVADTWRTLPESIADQYPTSEHLRKRGLIQCGYADERSIVCASKAEALRVAAFIKPMDEYAVVLVRECVVKVFTAQSQNMRSMGKARFQESKQRVLDWCASLLGVAPAALERNAREAA